MDSSFVGERTSADYRLVNRNRDARVLLHKPCQMPNLSRLDTSPNTANNLQVHANLLESCIARPLTDPANCCLWSVEPGLHGSKSVGSCQPEIVVAVNRVAARPN